MLANGSLSYPVYCLPPCVCPHARCIAAYRMHSALFYHPNLFNTPLSNSKFSFEKPFYKHNFPFLHLLNHFRSIFIVIYPNVIPNSSSYYCDFHNSNTFCLCLLSTRHLDPLDWSAIHWRAAYSIRVVQTPQAVSVQRARFVRRLLSRVAAGLGASLAQQRTHRQ